MKQTPHRARVYILWAAFFFALPSLAGFYDGYGNNFIIASRNLPNESFHEAVIDLHWHRLWGAHGYIINKRIEASSLKNLSSSALQGLPPPSDTVRYYFGGPVDFPEHHIEVRTDEGINIYLGYAGWFPLQLEYEMLKGVWHTVPKDKAAITANDPKTLWNNAIRSIPAASKGKPEGIF